MNEKQLALVLTHLGKALLAAADDLDGLSQPTPNHAPESRPKSARSVMAHDRRMYLQHAVLQGLMEHGGSMPKADFARMARLTGYTRGYAQFYADNARAKERLCTLVDGTVTITDKGRSRLAYAKEHLGSLRATG